MAGGKKDFFFRAQNGLNDKHVRKKHHKVSKWQNLSKSPVMDNVWRVMHKRAVRSENANTFDGLSHGSWVMNWQTSISCFWCNKSSDVPRGSVSV